MPFPPISTPTDCITLANWLISEDESVPQPFEMPADGSRNALLIGIAVGLAKAKDFNLLRGGCSDCGCVATMLYPKDDQKAYCAKHGNAREYAEDVRTGRILA